MKWFPRRERIMRWLAACTTGGVFVLDGCDDQIAATVLAGMADAADGLASTFIDALFIKLTSDLETTASIHRTIEEIGRMLA